MFCRASNFNGQQCVPMLTLALNLAGDRRGRDGPMQVDSNGPDALHSKTTAIQAPTVLVTKPKCLEPFVAAEAWKSGFPVLRFETAEKCRKREIDLFQRPTLHGDRIGCPGRIGSDRSSVRLFVWSKKDRPFPVFR